MELETLEELVGKPILRKHPATHITGLKDASYISDKPVAIEFLTEHHIKLVGSERMLARSIWDDGHWVDASRPIITFKQGN